MAVKRRGNSWYAYFEPFRDRRQIGLKLDVQTKTEARQVEGMIIRACRTGSYESLDPTARESCIRMFHNQGWEVPLELQYLQSRGKSLPYGYAYACAWTIQRSRPVLIRIDMRSPLSTSWPGSARITRLKASGYRKTKSIRSND